MKKFNSFTYSITLRTLNFLTYPLLLLIRNRYVKGSVLHISYNVHICLETVHLLRDTGRYVGYLAVKSNKSNGPDICFKPSRIGPIRAYQEISLFLYYVLRFEIIHTHFGLGFSNNGWEFLKLSQLGRKIVWHHRGCSSRSKVKNEQLHPDSAFNICKSCDYQGKACSEGHLLEIRSVLEKVANVHLVTTPDLKDFYPESIHIPFFSPTISRAILPKEEPPKYNLGERLRLIQITNHPGIEGANEIQDIVNNLKRRGHKIDYILNSGVTSEEALRLMNSAHLTIGKMKMGYYANNQIESIALGVPCITFVREQWITPQLSNSAFFLTDLKHLEELLEKIINSPHLILEKALKCKETLDFYHCNREILNQYNEIYSKLT